MRVLVLSATAVVAALLFSCSPRAAVTPRDAFRDLKEAYRAQDAAALERQLSQDSLANIREATVLFSRMDDRQLGALSEKLGVPAGRLKRLSVRDYCDIALAYDRDRNVVRVATGQDIVGVNKKGNRAVIRVANGMDLPFVKEGPYWKFDMTLL
jgi:hypothetical protein